MVDVHSRPTPLTVHLPADLIAELQRLAAEKQLSVDEIVQEACLAYTEPYGWERCYKEWLRARPEQRAAEYGIDGNDFSPPSSEASSCGRVS
jgi:hypothetical protein